MTFFRFFTSRYTESLESQVAELRCQLAQERQEVRRLTEVLVPSLQRSGLAVNFSSPLKDVEKKAHLIIKAADQKAASCACGWKDQSDDPVELQSAISEHYKLSFPPLKAKRQTASETIRALEAQSLEESTKNQRTQA